MSKFVILSKQARLSNYNLLFCFGLAKRIRLKEWGDLTLKLVKSLPRREENKHYCVKAVSRGFTMI